MQENADQNNSEYEHFLRSENLGLEIEWNSKQIQAYISSIREFLRDERLLHTIKVNEKL